MITTTKVKHCTICGDSKPLYEYSTNPRNRDGRVGICRDCDAKKQKAYREKIGKPEMNRRQSERFFAPRRPSGKTREDYIRELTLNKYDLSTADFHALLKQQGNCCAICREQFDLTNGYRNCHIDHEAHPHDTRNKAHGRVRGLLCNSCNNGIGRFRHDPERLRNAADYLEGKPCYVAE
jgi:Recombination endonuclease VII